MTIKKDEISYFKNNKTYTRVSSILNVIHSAGLEKFQRLKGFKYVDEIFTSAGERGTLFHRQAENFIDGTLNDKAVEIMEKNNPDMGAMIRQFKIWFKLKVKEVILKEETFFDDDLMVAGTPDLLIKDHKDKIILVDYKTGAKVLKKHRFQLSAYKHLIEKNLKIKIDRRMVLHIRPDKMEIVEFKDDQKDLSFFLMARSLYFEMGDE